MFKNLLFVIAALLFNGSMVAQTNDNLYFVFLNSNPDKAVVSDEQAETIQEAHMQNIDRLAEEGKLFAAGPFEDGGGMFILHAESLEEANSYLQTDPAVQANRFNTEVFPFQLAHGNMCGASKPYKMVTYQMIRFTNNAKNDGQENTLTHNTRIFIGEISEKNNIVAQGYFNNQADGVLILNVESPNDARKIFKKHPSVKSGKMTYEIKTLWIAKGTFCE